MSDWLKNNAVLALGISLPLLLIALLLLIQAMTRLGQTPPEHAVVYASFDHYSPELYFDFRIDAQGRLLVVAKNPEKPPYNRRTPIRANIAVFDAASGRHDTYALQPPLDLAANESVALELPRDLAELRLSGSPLAPDGYRFEAKTGGSGGLFPSLFGYDRRRETALINDGARYTVPEIEGYHGTKRLIGWVIDER